jgi:hypothetical protein
VLAAGCNLGVPSRFFPMTVEGDVLSDLALGDLNGDGHVDVVAVGIGRYGVALGDGAGHFTVTQVASSSVWGGRLALADIDGDGRLDQVYRGASGRVDVRRGDGAGHFSATRQILPVPNESLNGAVLGEDLDGDADVDVVAGGAGGTVVWRNDGSGGFAQPFVVETPSDLLEVTVADVDEDGVPDLLATSRAEAGGTSDTAVSVALGDGAGHFVEPHDIVGGVRLATADLDGNGEPDLVAACLTGHRLNVLLNHLDGARDHD